MLGWHSAPSAPPRPLAALPIARIAGRCIPSPIAARFREHFKNNVTADSSMLTGLGDARLKICCHIGTNFVDDCYQFGIMLSIDTRRAPMHSATETNQPKLSTRAQKALELLADGGEMTYKLERNSYTGREQFQVRFRRPGCSPVKGLGHATREELLKAGIAFRVSSSSSIGQGYKLDHTK